VILKTTCVNFLEFVEGMYENPPGHAVRNHTALEVIVFIFVRKYKNID